MGECPECEWNVYQGHAPGCSHNQSTEQEDNKMGWDEMYDILVEANIATEEEIALVTNINGASEETMKSILYSRTGFRDFDQMND